MQAEEKSTPVIPARLRMSASYRRLRGRTSCARRLPHLAVQHCGRGKARTRLRDHPCDGPDEPGVGFGAPFEYSALTARRSLTEASTLRAICVAVAISADECQPVND